MPYCELTDERPDKGCRLRLPLGWLPLGWLLLGCRLLGWLLLGWLPLGWLPLGWLLLGWLPLGWLLLGCRLLGCRLLGCRLLGWLLLGWLLLRWLGGNGFRHFLQGFQPMVGGGPGVMVIFLNETEEEQLLLPTGQRIPVLFVYRWRIDIGPGPGKQPCENPIFSQRIFRLPGDGIGVEAGEQLEDEDGQTEEVVVWGPVGVVALCFWSLKLGTPHPVGEWFAGGGVSEPVGVAIHHRDVVLPVDFNVLFVDIADDVTVGVNGAES